VINFSGQYKVMTDIILNQQLSTLHKNISQTFDQTESIELHKLAPLLSCSRGNSAVEFLARD
jgi:hypothetical protein